jgi:hypothetical protein
MLAIKENAARGGIGPLDFLLAIVRGDFETVSLRDKDGNIIPVTPADLTLAVRIDAA